MGRALRWESFRCYLARPQPGGSQADVHSAGPHGEAERGELHTAQRASKATLNSFSLLVLFSLWLSVFFLLLK